MSKAPPGGPVTPIGPTDTVRIVTNDFMFTGGDGYARNTFVHGAAPAVPWRRWTSDRSPPMRRTRIGAPYAAGFCSAETVDDDEWAAVTSEPLDRCLATFDKGRSSPRCDPSRRR